MTVIEKAHDTAKRLHEGKAYGNDSNMFNQLEETVKAIEGFTGLTGTDRDNVIAATYLSKCQEQSKLGEGQVALSDDELVSEFGVDVAKIVKEVNAEPKEDKTQSADKIWLDKIYNWAEKCTPATREILMAEKRANFVTSFTAPSDKKEPAWHAGYYLTRMLMVEALRGTNEALYQHLRGWAVKGIALQVQKMANEEKKPVLDVFGQLAMKQVIWPESHMASSDGDFTQKEDYLLKARYGLLLDAQDKAIFLQQEKLKSPIPQKIEPAEGEKSPVKPTQKPIDSTNKTVFTYVYGKGVIR